MLTLIMKAVQNCIRAMQYELSHTGERLQTKHFLILSQYTVYQKEKVQPRSGVVIRLLCVFWAYAPSGGQEENPSAR